MEKANKRILYEALLLNHIAEASRAISRDEVYAGYQDDMYQRYSYLESRLYTIIGYHGKGTTADDLIKYVSTLQLNDEQRRELAQFRKDPSVIRIIGEAALSKRIELERILGGKITNQGMAFADQNGVAYAQKSAEQLEQELDTYSTRLSQLLSSKTITEEQYDEYMQNLNDIYNYYVSSSKGELLESRELSAHDYHQILNKAEENGVSFKEQFASENEKLALENEELQELQEQGIKK